MKSVSGYAFTLVVSVASDNMATSIEMTSDDLDAACARAVTLIQNLAGTGSVSPNVDLEPDGPVRKGRPHAAPGEVATEGTLMWNMLRGIADNGGRFEGSMAGLARSVGGCDPSASKAGKVLVKEGLIRVEKMNSTQTRAVCLTDAGWAHIGRDIPSTPAAPAPAPAPAAVETVGQSVSRRRFNADAARSAAASAI